MNVVGHGQRVRGGPAAGRADGPGRLHGLDRDVRARATSIPRPAGSRTTPCPTRRTSYGVYKLANEGTARVYWAEHGLSSIGLRPYTVYGPARDQGLTSTPTKAIVAAVLGRPYTITFGGRTVFQYAEDVAETLLVASRERRCRRAHLPSRRATWPTSGEFVAAIDAAVPGAADRIEVVEPGLPFPEDVAREAIARPRPGPGDAAARRASPGAAAVFRALHERGALVAEEQGLEPERARLTAVGASPSRRATPGDRVARRTPRCRTMPIQ